MTDEQIIKALECHADTDIATCKICAYDGVVRCGHQLCYDALGLINRQKAENENLKDILYDADGVNLVNYWHQQYKIAENGCKNFAEENESQKAEIERLTHNLEAMAQTMPNMAKAERAEAVKEFAERLKAKFSCLEYVIKTSRKTMPVERVKAEVDTVLQNGCPNVIDKILKEMVGTENGNS